MKVRPSVKPMCKDCRIIRRRGVVRIICRHAKHKQRQPGAARSRVRKLDRAAIAARHTTAA